MFMSVVLNYHNKCKINICFWCKVKFFFLGEKGYPIQTVTSGLKILVPGQNLTNISDI